MRPSQRGAWLAVCALSLARAARETPLPADPELNAKWLADFRRQLLRDAYDYETDARSSPSILGDQSSALSLYLTRAPDNTSTTPRADHAPYEALGIARDSSARRDLNKSVARVPDRSNRPLDALDASTVHGSSRTDSRDAGDRITWSPDASSGEPDEPPDESEAPLSRRASSKPARYGLDTGRPLARYAVKHSSNKSHQPDVPTVGTGSARDVVGRVSPAGVHSDTSELDAAASRELGISRRDLYGGSITDQELDAKRRPFLDTLAELDEQLRPVVVRPDRRGGRSRKRLREHQRNPDKPPYIVDQNGIKRYKVHTDPGERFRNQFGGDEPWFKEEWGLGEFDTHRAANGRNEDHERSNDENQAQNGYQEQESGDDGSTRDERSSSREVDVSEYRERSARSRYVQDGDARQDGPQEEYARRFSARRDAALLADGLAAPSTPCACATDHDQTHLVPDL